MDMKQVLRLLAIICIFSGLAAAQARSKKPIEGVWKVAEIVSTGDGARTVSNPQPGLLIIAKKHYSYMYIPGEKARSPFAGDVVTQQEKLDAFDSFFANAGTYEQSGTVVTMTPLVAKNPGFEGGGYVRYQVRIEGENLWLTAKNNDFYFRKNGKILPAPGPAGESTIKFLRLE
jgi:hypothetical protein